MSEATIVESNSAELRVITPKQTVRQQLRDIWRYRELLGGLVRKELKVKYKDSILGFAWSLLNPALYLAVYYLVFQVIFNNGVPRYAIYLLCGLLVWNFFSTAIAGATGAVVSNAAIVKKVAFPREILALASVGASLVHFCLQSAILLGSLVLFRHAPSLEYLVLLPLALLAIVLLASSIGIILSAVNVRLRDTAHLIELVLLVWFWFTPIVYGYQVVASRMWEHGLQPWLFRLNPVTPVTLSMQRMFYNDGLTPPSFHEYTPHNLIPDEGLLWYAGQLGWVIALGAVLFVGALAIFGRMQGDFAEEL